MKIILKFKFLRILALLTLFSLSSCEREHDKGYEDGVNETREAINDGGVIGGAAQELKADYGSGRKGESSDYNAGYREGINDELDQSYPNMRK